MDTIENSSAGAERQEGSSSPRGFKSSARLVAPVIAALLVGGGAVFAFDHNSGSDASAGTQQAAFGGGPGGAGGPGAGGAVAGEQHVQGTVSATTATTVTVTTSSGTATYTVNALTQIVRDGKKASLGAVKAGDPVLVHVYPSSTGSMLVERLFAGTSATGGGPGFGPPVGPGANGPGGPSGV